MKRNRTTERHIEYLERHVYHIEAQVARDTADMREDLRRTMRSLLPSLERYRLFVETEMAIAAAEERASPTGATSSADSALPTADGILAYQLQATDGDPDPVLPTQLPTITEDVRQQDNLVTRLRVPPKMDTPTMDAPTRATAALDLQTPTKPGTLWKVAPKGIQVPPKLVTITTTRMKAPPPKPATTLPPATQRGNSSSSLPSRSIVDNPPELPDSQNHNNLLPDGTPVVPTSPRTRASTGILYVIDR